MKNKILEMTDIDKSFPGVKALSKASLDLYSGEVNVILGENGAGKSTLMKVLTGVHQKDSGKILLNGKEIAPVSPKEANKLGISIIYQEFNLLPDMTVAENIHIGREPKNFLGVIDEKKLISETQSTLDRLNLDIKPSDKVDSLSVGEQQMVEIAKAISLNSNILIMDEPTAALTEKEIDELFKVMKDLKAKGVGIIYISHRLEEFERIADRVTVLRDGKYIDNLNFKETTLDELIKLMVGRSLEDKFPKRDVKIGETLFSVEGLNQKDQLEDINFEVKAGEVLGISGIMGAGRTELARAIFGATPIDSGELTLENKKIKISSPRDAIKLGIAYLTEDRKKDGLLLNQTVEDNIMIANPEIYSNFGVCDFNTSKEISNKYVDDLGIKTPSIYQKVKNLSGGNQQKVILARWLCQKKKVLIIDEPTRGIDVGAKREVYQLVNELVKDGAAVIMISSELPEVMGMSDRIMVMHEGKIAKTLLKEEFSQEKIIYYATGGI